MAAWDISPHTHRPGHLSSVWLPALWEETLGPAHILGSLLHLPLVPSPDVCAVTFTRMPACRCWVRFGQATPGWGGRGVRRVEPT